MSPKAVVNGQTTAQERIGQTRRGLVGLRAEIETWTGVRERSDEQRQYVTQLRTLKAQLLYLLSELEPQCGEVSASDGIRTVYARCRVIDKRLLWIRRLWTYFQSKFDQRYDDKFKKVLKAADDVVWSCYAQPFRITGEERPPHPLPFVASVYSPYAIPRDEPPPDLRSDVDADFLAQMLRSMPISVVGTPSQAIEEPWRLAFLAHEVGHHVQFDFQKGVLIDSFAKTLLDAGGERWQGWNKELFADIFSLMMIGQWALWALAELIWTDTPGMLDDTNPRYPCPLVRLMFMATVADKVKLKGSAALRGLQSADLLDAGPVLIKKRDVRDSVKEDLEQLDKVATAVANAELGAGLKLSDLCEFDAADFQVPDGVAHLWGEVLAGRAGMVPDQSLKSSRLVLSGGVEAWAEICEVSDTAEREERRGSLKDLLPWQIVANREAITRAVEPMAEPDINTRNKQLAKLLLGDDVPGLESLT